MLNIVSPPQALEEVTRPHHNIQRIRPFFGNWLIRRGEPVVLFTTPLAAAKPADLVTEGRRALGVLAFVDVLVACCAEQSAETYMEDCVHPYQQVRELWRMPRV